MGPFLVRLKVVALLEVLAAMSIIDSEAAFERKCKDLRNGEELYNGLQQIGVRDFSTLAFTLGTPQKAPTDEQFEDLGAKVYGTPTIGQLALLRKLHFEATTLMVASINEQVKSDSADPLGLAKRLPAAEKQSRLDSQSKRLAGLRIVGELAPSHQLLDLTNSMVESGVLTWVAPSKCSKRDDEVQANIKPTSSTLQIEQATLKVAQVPVNTVADVGSELKLQWALQRRGIAMDQCRLLDWAIHEDWVQWLLQSLTKDVPTGFGSIKLEQVVRADKELWTLLAQQQTKSLKPNNDVPAINEEFRKLTTDPRVTMFVLPPAFLESTRCSSEASSSAETGSDSESWQQPEQEKEGHQSREELSTRTQELQPPLGGEGQHMLELQFGCWVCQLHIGYPSEVHERFSCLCALP